MEITADQDVTVELSSAVLSGSVLSATDRQPVPGASVEIVPLGPFPRQLRARRSLTTDAIGRFELLRVTRDVDWYLTVTVDGYAVARRGVTLSGLANEIEVLLQRAAPVVLQILDRDGRPPPSVEIEASDERGRPLLRRRYQPDQEGKVVIRSLAPGRARLNVSDSQSNASVEIEVPGPAVTVVMDR